MPSSVRAPSRTIEVAPAEPPHLVPPSARAFAGRRRAGRCANPTLWPMGYADAIGDATFTDDPEGIDIAIHLLG